MWALDCHVSDHCPLVLRYTTGGWGPKLFRFNNHWLEHKDFKEVVRKSSAEANPSGWMGFILEEKLKNLKCSLKHWNKDTYRDADQKIQSLVENIKSLHLKSEEVALSREELTQRKERLSQLKHILKNKDRLTFQRSKSKWLKEGDANTHFFHACIKS